MTGYVNGIRKTGKSRYSIRVKVDGRIRRATLPTQVEAERVRNQLRAQNTARRLGIVFPTTSRAPTLPDVLDRHVAQMRALGRAEKSVEQVEYVKALWIRWGGEKRPASLSYDDLVDFAGWARLNTKSKRGRAIQAAIGIARTAIGRAGLPVPKAPAVTVDRRNPKTVERAEVLRFLAELPAGSVERTFAEFVFRTARRESEARRLAVGDVDLARGIVTFRPRKGRRGGGEIPLGPRLVEILRVYLVGRCQGIPADAPLFAVDSTRGETRGRHSLTEWSLSKRFEPAGRRAGIGKRVRTLGWLRNQAATEARRLGQSLDDVSLALGHGDISTTARHYVEDTRRAARGRLAGRLDALAPLAGYTESGAGERGTERDPSSPRSALDRPKGKREKPRKR